LGDGDNCTAAIYNRAGRVVFRTTGVNVVFDEDETGEDFDGDGKPEVVFKTDTGGGMHCCWTYNIVSLTPAPHKLFDIAAAGKVDFEKDSTGRMLIWTRDAGPYGWTSMARNPFAERAWRVEKGRRVDVTPEFCSTTSNATAYESPIEKNAIPPDDLKRFQSAESNIENFDREEVVSTLLSRTLQHFFCHEYDEALSDLNLWPESERPHVKSDFADSIRADYPDFATRLVASSRNK
jgi:hypothetical protein